MTDKDNFVKDCVLYFSLFATVSLLTSEIGYLPDNFYDSLNSEHVLEFVGITFYLSFFVVGCILSALIGYGFVFLVWRVSLRYIYRKPCRVYPAEESKENKLFSLR